VQDGQVARDPRCALTAQAGERPGDGLAHERKDRAVRGEADGIGSAAVQSRRDARDEGGVVGKPPVHVRDPLDGEPAAGQGRFQRCQPRVGRPRQSRGLRPDADVVGGPVGHDAADAGEPEVGIAGQVAGDGRPAGGVVAEEDDGWLSG